ncbi:hypothetical protein L9F63_008921, partial [Diploptera punctata]
LSKTVYDLPPKNKATGVSAYGRQNAFLAEPVQLKFNNDVHLLYHDTDSLVLHFTNSTVHPLITMTENEELHEETTRPPSTFHALNNSLPSWVAKPTLWATCLIDVSISSHERCTKAEFHVVQNFPFHRCYQLPHVQHQR